MTSIDLSKHLLQKEGNQLANIAKRSVQELTKHRGIGPAKGAIIAACIELGKRLNNIQPDTKPYIKDSETAYHFIKPYLAHKAVEEAWLILLNRHSRVIRPHQVSRGGLAKTTIDPRVIFKAALEYQCHGLILAHNHPSGKTTPSSADIDITSFLEEGAKLLDLKIMDHLIVAPHSYFSFADNGLL
jgi:DNA repair protein RadC